MNYAIHVYNTVIYYDMCIIGYINSRTIVLIYYTMIYNYSFIYIDIGIPW